MHAGKPSRNTGRADRPRRLLVSRALHRTRLHVSVLLGVVSICAAGLSVGLPTSAASPQRSVGRMTGVSLAHCVSSRASGIRRLGRRHRVNGVGGRTAATERAGRFGGEPVCGKAVRRATRNRHRGVTKRPSRSQQSRRAAGQSGPGGSSSRSRGTDSAAKRGHAPAGTTTRSQQTPVPTVSRRGVVRTGVGRRRLVPAGGAAAWMLRTLRPHGFVRVPRRHSGVAYHRAIMASDVSTTTMTLPTSGEVSVYVASKNALNAVGLAVSAPGSDPVCSDCQPGDHAQVGPFQASSQLAFTFTDETCNESWPSTNTAHVRVVQAGPGDWQMSYDDGGGGCSGGDGDFNDLVVDVTAQGVSPQESLGNNGGSSGLEKSAECRTANPVNCATGNFTHSFTDFAIPGDGMPLDLSRTYNSLAASTPGLFGYGWTSSYEMKLTTDSSGDVTVAQEDGAQATFNPDGSGGFTAPPKVLGTLVRNADGTYTLTRRGSQLFKFSAAGQLLTESDLNGQTTTLSYSSGQLTTVTDPAGRTLTFAYNSQGFVSSVTDPAGRSIQYGYDSSGNLTSVSGLNGGSWQFGYDANHLLTSMSDPRSDGSLTNVYNSNGQVTSQTDEANRTTTFSYQTNSDGSETTTITDPNNNVTVENYTGGVLVSETEASGTPQAATWTYGFDATLGVSKVVDPNGQTWTASYDLDGNQTGTTAPDGQTTSAVFNGFDEPTSTTDANGIATTYTYDSSGNLLSTSRPLTSTGQTQTTSYTYADSAHPGDPTAMTDPDGNAWSYAYGINGELTSSTDPAGDQTTFAYGCSGGTAAGCYPNIGLLYATTSPRGNVSGATASQYTTTYAYNALGEATSTTNPVGASSTATYDSDGNLATSTDANKNTTSYTYDADNELTQTKRADGTTIKTGYDSDGNVTSQTDGNNNQTTYVYNPLNQLSSQTDPSRRTTSYTYDGNGNLLTVNDPLKRTTTYGYNHENWLASTSYSDNKTPNVTYTYYPNGQRKTMTDGTGTTTYSYDSLDRLTASTDGNKNSTSYGYDLADNETSITYPNGKTVTQTFDKVERLQSVSDWLGNTTGFGYDSDSNLSTTTYPAATRNADSYGYNDADAVTSTAFNAAGKPKASLTETRDLLGNVTSEVQSGLPGTSSNNYSYNSLNQLTSASTGPPVPDFAYDNAGNVTELNGRGGYDYDNSDQLTSSPASADPDQTSPAVTNYGYSPLGERTSATLGGGNPTSYQYDQASRLTKVSPASYTVSVGGGQGYSMALQSNGTLVAWGAQPNGELGIGSTTTTQTPTEVHDLTGVTQVSNNYADSLALKADGSVWSWGSNAEGDLGDGTTTTRTTPVKVVGLPIITSVATGLADGYAVDAGGNVWGWGDETAGELGNGITGWGNISPTPAKIPGISSVSQIAAGGETVLALKSDGTVWSWGNGVNGELGTGQSVSATPTQVPGLSGITQVAEIQDTSYALDSSGHVWSWGAGSDGQLGNATTTQSQATPVEAGTPSKLGFISLTNITKLVSGSGSHMLAEKNDGTVWAWGVNSSGQLGDGATTNSSVAVQVQGLTSPIALGEGSAHSLAATSPTSIEAWGSNSGYQLGNASNNPNPTSTAAILYQGVPAAPTASYTYNGDGLQMSRTVSGNTSQFVWNTSDGLPQLLTDGTNSYIYGPNDIPIEQISTSGTVSYLHHDQLGSIRVVTNSNGAIVGTASYNPYGTPSGTTGQSTSPFGYAGQYTDPNTGLVYLRARYYDPQTAQFLTQDPLVALTGQAYNYAGDNPVNNVDPSGEAPPSRCFAILGAWICLGGPIVEGPHGPPDDGPGISQPAPPVNPGPQPPVQTPPPGGGGDGGKGGGDGSSNATSGGLNLQSGELLCGPGFTNPIGPLLNLVPPDVSRGPLIYPTPPEPSPGPLIYPTSPDLVPEPPIDPALPGLAGVL